MSRYPGTLTLLLLVAATGCGGSKTPPKGGDIPRVDLRVKSHANLQQIKFAYLTALTTSPPRNLDDLKAQLEGGDRMLTSPVDNQPYEIVYGVDPAKLQTPTSETLLVWEKTGDKDGNRNILTAGGQIKQVTAAEFEKMPKAKGK
jgi:hypothetical protein